MFILYFAVLFAYVIFGSCQSSPLVIDVVEITSMGNSTFVCNIPLSTNLTRWTYLAGPTETSFMSYQNGRCTVSPSGNFLGDGRYSYACNSTAHTVSLHLTGANEGLNNLIISCRDAVQRDNIGSTWMIKIVHENPCTTCQQTIPFSIREIKEGDDVTFICSVSSDVPYVHWNSNTGSNTAAMGVHNGQCTTQGTTYLDNTSKYIYTCNNTVYQVTLLNVKRSEHNDMYMCTSAHEKEGRGSNWIVKVKAPVLLVTLLSNRNHVDVIGNLAVKFTCTASTARPASSVLWYKHQNGNSNDKTRITENITATTDYNDFSVTMSTLRFFPTRHDNNMKIYCEANNAINTSPVKSSTDILLNILFPPTVARVKNISKHVDEKLKMNCLYTAGVPAQTSVRWTRDIDDTQWDGEQLYISSITRSDAGYYYCNASNVMKPSGDSNSYIGHSIQSFYLDVLYEASITSFNIEGYTQETVTVNEDDPVRFVCNAESNPTATMTLSHDSKTLKTGATNRLEYNVTKASCLDAGIYVCDAYNRVNSQFAVLKLQVRCHPRAAKYVDGNLKTDTGSSIKIMFNVIAYPPPTFKWYQLVNGTWTLLTENDKYRMSSSAVQSNLTIHSVGTNDFTSYKVISANEFGNMEQEYTLSPYGEDSFTSPGLLIGGIIGGTIGIIVLVALGIIVVRRHGYLNACSTIRKSQDNTINSPVEESAYNNIGCVPEYEMINQGSRESIPYSSLEPTQQSETSDNQNERKKDVYENL